MYEEQLRIAAVAREDNEYWLQIYHDTNLLNAIKLPPIVDGDLISVKWYPNGKYVLVTTPDAIYVIEPAPTKTRELPIPVKDITVTALSNNGQFLAVGSEAGAIYIFEMPTDNKPLQLVSLFKKHKTPVSCLEFEFTSDKLLSSSRDSLLYKSDVLTGRELQCCEGHKNKITHIASMNSDACFTASAVEDERVIWWDLNLGIERRSVRLSEGDSVYDAAAYDMKVSPRTGSLLITTINQYVNQWNIVAMTLTVLSIAAFEILVAGKYHAFVGTNLINVYDLWFDFRYSLSIPGLMVQDAISV